MIDLIIVILIILIMEGIKMYDYNKVFILGNLTKDPVLRPSSDGIVICDIRIAVNNKWFDKNGLPSENVEFFNVRVWNRQAQNCIESLTKGDRVMISGHFNSGKIEDNESKTVKILNINADSVAASLEFNKVKVLKEGSVVQI